MLPAIKIEMCLEKETKGALRYQETHDGVPIEKGYKIGTLYIRKDAFPTGQYPTILDVTIERVQNTDKV